jgi:hypothetical protein
MMRIFSISILFSFMPFLAVSAQESLPRGDVRPGPEADPNEMPNLQRAPDGKFDRLNRSIEDCIVRKMNEPQRRADTDIIGRSWGADIINPVLRTPSKPMLLQCMELRIKPDGNSAEEEN